MQPQRILFLLLCTCLAWAGRAQSVTFYKSYAEYQSNKGTVYEGDYVFGSSRYLLGKVAYTLKPLQKDSNLPSINFRPRDYWGFRWGKELYLCSQYDAIFHVAVISPKLCYLQVGADMEIPLAYMRNGRQFERYLVAAGFIAKSLNSDIYMIYGRRNKEERQANLEKVFSPSEIASLSACWGNMRKPTVILACLKHFVRQ